jgi:predicted nucleotidyltransferase
MTSLCPSIRASARPFSRTSRTGFRMRPVVCTKSAKRVAPPFDLRDLAFTQYVTSKMMSPKTRQLYHDHLYPEFASVVRNVLGAPSCTVEVRGSIANGTALETSDMDVFVGNDEHSSLSQQLEQEELMPQLQYRLSHLNLTPNECDLTVREVILECGPRGLKGVVHLSNGQRLRFDLVFRHSYKYAARNFPHELDPQHVREAIVACKVLAADRDLPDLDSLFYCGLIRLAWSRKQQQQQPTEQCSSHQLFLHSLEMLESAYAFGDSALLEDDMEPFIAPGHDKLVTGEQMKVWQRTATSILNLHRRLGCTSTQHFDYMFSNNIAKLEAHCLHPHGTPAVRPPVMEMPSHAVPAAGVHSMVPASAVLSSSSTHLSLALQPTQLVVQVPTSTCLVSISSPWASHGTFYLIGPTAVYAASSAPPPSALAASFLWTWALFTLALLVCVPYMLHLKQSFAGLSFYPLTAPLVAPELSELDASVWLKARRGRWQSAMGAIHRVGLTRVGGREVAVAVRMLCSSGWRLELGVVTGIERVGSTLIVYLPIQVKPF